MKLLKDLCECAGIPGREGRLREIVRRELTPLADELRVDALGNLVAIKKASRGRKSKKLMIAAHMDPVQQSDAPTPAIPSGGPPHRGCR